MCDCEQCAMGEGPCGIDWNNRGLGCLTYIFTGRAGNCVMLPVWRSIGRFFRIG